MDVSHRAAAPMGYTVRPVHIKPPNAIENPERMLLGL